VLTVPPNTINSNHTTPDTNPSSPSMPDTYPLVLTFNIGEQPDTAQALS
jgi:hypothetical protein